MEERKNKKRKMIVSILLAVGVLALTIGVTVAFFNYTRTGLANNIETGRIYFNTTQSGTLNMTNIFPLTSTQAGNANLNSVTVTITGDTTYENGEEFEITLVDVNNTINNKSIPINYIATYTGGTIGESSNDYWNARESKNASIYTFNATGSVEEGKQVLVGYIDNGATGINGTLTIKAYLDADRIAISDTYDGTESDDNGTTTDWVDGRTVFTTTEWNSFQSSGTPISFKIRAESNEGIWVEEPIVIPTMQEMCPGCVFTYTRNSLNYGDNGTVLTSNDYQETIPQYDDYFLGMILDQNGKITRGFSCGIHNDIPFCLEGTTDGSKDDYNKRILDSVYGRSACLDWHGGYYCEGSPDSIFEDGRTQVGYGDEDYCYVENNGTMSCYNY